MDKYDPSRIEPKWQKRWKKSKLYSSRLSHPNKFYVLAEFAYPSGDLHMGHWFTFTGADIYVRFKRMQGYNVFFPNGFDAFGLPAENAAIKREIHPQDWTMANIARMKEQFASLGGSFTFDHEVITCLPKYYKWNQWIFLQMFKKGLVYRGAYQSNWCNQCQTVLANEAVEAGTCWRCGTQVIQREVEQWFFKITAYADRLIWPENPSVDWPKSLQEAQNNWIGKSEGVSIKFDSLEVFTTRPDTLFGATFMVISPEHPLLDKFTTDGQKTQVKEYTQETLKKSELERRENREKSGVFAGSYVKNPLNGENLPVWVADYVLSGYGTGAIMAVPAHDQRDFEFAKKYKLEIREVVSGGVLINSGEFSGQKSADARKNITKWLEEHQLGKKQIVYHLRDWSISRQRYWGTPIPVIHCQKCDIVPVSEEDLPVVLPYEVNYTPKGKSPLASNEEWLKTTCPKCGEKAERDPDTMDTFVDSSWYFFRYISPDLKNAPFDIELAKKMMPVDIYFGGAEHNLGHTLYSRFFTKFFHDLGLTDLEEYALKRINHGIVLGSDGQKMSKSRGNVVNPDEEVKKFGADAVRIHLAFFMPYEATGPWVSERIWGPYRFLERVWQLSWQNVKDEPTPEDLLGHLHRLIKKVSEDLDHLKFNTAIAAMMEFINEWSRSSGSLNSQEAKIFLQLLSPFAPHITEELWSRLGGKFSIHQSVWPKYDLKLIQEEVATVVVQVNGKLRTKLEVQSPRSKVQSEIAALARQSDKVNKYLAGKKIKKVIFIPGKLINFVI